MKKIQGDITFINVFLYFSLIFFLFLAISCSRNIGKFILVNECEELIRRAHIKISETVFELENIKPRESREARYVIKGDSHYEIAITFESGKKIQAETGYVTHGFNFKHIIHIANTGITLSDTEIN